MSPNKIPTVLGPVRVTPSMLPSKPNEDFLESAYFQHHKQLPSPEEVRSEAQAQQKGFWGPVYVHPTPVLFKSLGLVVKWGFNVTVSEGQCLYAIRRFLPRNAVPVPEVFGWRTENNHVYIYMETFHGQTLEDAWDVMETDSRNEVCSELHTIFNNLRQFEQDPLDPFIGSITRSDYYDRVIKVDYMKETGPFTSVKDFRDWYAFLCRRPMADPYSVNLDAIRFQLPDDAAIKLTHGDLHRSNIIVTSSKPYHVVGIVDWEQSGWLPEYWEERKAYFTAFPSEEWATVYLPKILKQYKSTEQAWGFFADSMV